MTPASFLPFFFCAIVTPGEALRPPVFVLYHPMGMGDLGGQEQLMLFRHLCVVGRFMCLWVYGADSKAVHESIRGSPGAELNRLGLPRITRAS